MSTRNLNKITSTTLYSVGLYIYITRQITPSIFTFKNTSLKEGLKLKDFNMTHDKIYTHRHKIRQLPLGVRKGKKI